VVKGEDMHQILHPPLPPAVKVEEEEEPVLA
jgi:hypothetical protein